MPRMRAARTETRCSLGGFAWNEWAARIPIQDGGVRKKAASVVLFPCSTRGGCSACASGDGKDQAAWFNQVGIYHPDDMSGIILDSFWRKLNNKPIGLDEQIKYYQDYWRTVDREESEEKQTSAGR